MVKRIYNIFANDSLYKNSIYLMASTFIMAAFGFVFWMVNARLFTTEQIGLATTLISVTSLLSSISLLGLNTALIRYLPNSKRKNSKINSSFVIISLAATVISVIFLIGLNIFSPKLLFLQENPIYLISFIIFIIFSALNGVIESIFIALRSSKYVLVKSIIYSIFKLILPFFLVAFGVYGIFSSWMIALTIAFIFSFSMLIIKFSYRFKLTINKSEIKEMAGFSFGNYIAATLGSAPTMLLPVIITNKINPETTAYYYMAMMIANLLFIIPSATTQSLFAEGSYDEKELRQHIIKAIKIISLILIPAILFTIFFGKYVLFAFGEEYSEEGFRFLQILALSGVFIAFNSIYGTILNVRKRIKMLIFISFISAFSILGLSYLFLGRGLLGVGVAWIIGQGIVSFAYLLFFRR